MTRSTCLWSWCCGLMLVLSLVSCSKTPKPGEVLDEARLAGRPAASFPAADEDYFHDMDRCARHSRADSRRDQGPQHVAGVDRRQRSPVGRDDGQERRELRPAEDHFVVPRLESQPRQSLELSRPGQRALLQESHRTRSQSLRPVARQPRPRLPRRSLREREQISGRQDRRARQEYSGRLVLRIRDRHRRPAALSQSRLRRSGREEVGPEALLRRSQLLQRQEAGQALSRRHVVRLLPRWAESRQASGRS